jgi:dTDP-4-dehydrorhamnose 3,5-epimerase
MIRATPGRLAGVVLLEPSVYRDGRGFFVETARLDALRAAGIDDEFVQDNQSRSAHRTIRGLHYQEGPGQAKLVRVANGKIWDVVVDLRADSATFGEWEAYELDDVDHRSLYVPRGFAHGFAVLSESADAVYRVSAYYDAALERGLAWDDPELAIPWPFDDAILSDRDRRNPTLSQLHQREATPPPPS